MQKELQPLIRRLATKYGRPVEEVEKIMEAPYRFAYKIITEGSRETRVFYNVRILGFCIFYVKKTYEYMLNVGRLQKGRKNAGS